LRKVIQSIQDWFGGQTSYQKRGLALVCTAAFSVLLIISFIVSARKQDKEERALEPKAFNFSRAIPAEELFLDDEPDFLPGVLLERERRTSWTEEDAAEYWQDPLKLGEQGWRDKIESAIDEYLERVP